MSLVTTHLPGSAPTSTTTTMPLFSIPVKSAIMLTFAKKYLSTHAYQLEGHIGCVKWQSGLAGKFSGNKNITNLILGHLIFWYLLIHL